MTRRDTLLAAVAAALAGGRAQAREARAHAFDADHVAGLARALASRAYTPPPRRTPALGLDYARYVSLQYDRARAQWADQDAAFRAHFFLADYIYPTPVELYEVVDGSAAPIAYDPTLFSPPGGPGAGYSGLRLLSPINQPGVWDEIAVFQGASYFRSLGRDQGYGLSARGLALGVGRQREEFPVFTAFWLERPEPGAGTVVVHALMDSPSVAGAYRFAITPGAATVFDVEARLYPRRTIADAGAAPLTSMFWFGGPDPLPDASADYRSAVHDSDGLEILSGAGERLWRPLASPARLQTSAFADHNPRGFGLTQRARAFDAYGDLTARYDRRPSAWIEPSGDWGAGAVMLVELPTRTEYEDNIVAFWRPAEPWMAGSEVRLAYRLSWGDGVSPPTGLARVIRSRQGAADPAPARLFTIDFPGGSIPTDRAIRLDVTASAGQVISADVQRSADPDLMRASFRYMPPARGAAELRARLMADNQPASETWAWRWS